MSSKGIEFTLNTVNVRTRDFRWETSINIAHNTDRVDKVHIDENSYTPSKEGYSSSAVFAYKTAGLDEYGIPMFWKDGQKVSLREFTDFRLDKTDYGFFVLYDPQVSTSQSAIRNNLSYIGSQNPNITGGFNNRFYYKNFDLSVSCNFVFGQLVKRTPFYSPTQTSPGENNTTEIGQVWSPENTSGIYPALTGNLKPDGTTWSGWDEWEANPDPYYLYNWILEQYNSISGASLFDNLDIWYKKINYFRVNSIRLGYAFPEKITRKLHMAGLRIHFEARNPFVIASNYDGYFDPETYGSIYSQPMVRTYSVGLNITF